MTTATTQPPNGCATGQAASPPETKEQAARRNLSSLESRLGYSKRAVSDALDALAEAEASAILTIAAAVSARGASWLAESETTEIETITSRVTKRALASVRAANRAIDKAKADVKANEALVAPAKERVRILQVQREDAIVK